VTDDRAELDARLMRRVLRAAERGNPGPAPRSAALLARADEVLAQAARSQPSAAEPIASVLQRAAAAARGASLYVNLEPPLLGRDGVPLVEMLLAAGLKRVVIAHVPTRPHPSGGLRRLRRSGLEVIVGVGAAEAARQFADYDKYVRTSLPHVTLKAATTLDGRLAARSGESKWITGPLARREAHRMRARCDAVLVGVGTLLVDDPELTVRAVRGQNPLRVVLDSRLRCPLGCKLVRSARSVPTLIVHAARANPARARKLTAAGVTLLEVAPARHGRGVDLVQALRALARHGVVRLLVEGGAHVHAALLEAGLVDRASIFVAPFILADVQALPMAAGTRARRLDQAFVLRDPQVVRLGDDVQISGDVAVRASLTARVAR
jgi:diaminohydroxyphosphoribosylaminopyrimidine deaminase/5-amino-6-(5-phosphoribosylamino)uracil reductase